MKVFAGQSLLALALLIAVLVGNRPLVLATGTGAASDTSSGVGEVIPAATKPAPVAPATPADLPAAPASAAPASVAPAAVADIALHPCDVEAQRAACAAAAAELATYGLDIADVSQWTLVGLRRFVEAVEHLADALGGGGLRTGRVAALTATLRIGPGPARIVVVWQETPQDRGGSPVRGGYAADHLYFNPNTLFLDMDSPAEAAERDAAGIWWNFVHELAHLWDERSAPVAAGRYSARMQSWVRGQQSQGRDDEYPSSYAVIGGPAEAFAESVAATVTGDAPSRDYYGSPRDNFVRAILCEATNCRP